MRYFAQASKGFVEVVKSDKAPRLERSWLKKTYHDPWLGRKTTRKILVIAFSDSEVVAQISTRKFGQLTGHTLKPGTVWLLSATQAASIIKETNK
jgi:hypothetical protein